MNWKMKALVQNTVAVLPDILAQPVYYRLQNRFGNPAADIAPRYRSAAKMGRWARRYGKGFDNTVVLEIGTGRSVDVPIACWLMGARRIISVDLNHYLRPDLMQRSLAYLADHHDELIQLFADSAERTGFSHRLDALLTAYPDPDELPDFISLEYLPGSDARALPFESGSVDYSLSLNVFEHIPAEVLRGILEESKRLIGPHGMMIHFIDPSDHFAHGDTQISEINFLRYSERRWRRLAGNRFMYHNRLRASDYRVMAHELGLQTVHQEERLDSRCLSELRQGFPVDPMFSQYSEDDMAVTQYHLMWMPEAV